MKAQGTAIFLIDSIVWHLLDGAPEAFLGAKVKALYRD